MPDETPIPPQPRGSYPKGVARRQEILDRAIEVVGLVQLYSTLVAAALEEGHPAAHEFATTRFAGLRQDLAARVRLNQQVGRIRADLDPEAIAALVIAASDGLQTQWLLDPDAPQDAALALLEKLLSRP